MKTYFFETLVAAWILMGLIAVMPIVDQGAAYRVISGSR